MTYASDLAKLKRSTARNKKGPRPNLPCSVCGARPSPQTRFGPRCLKHRPHDEDCAAVGHHTGETGPCNCGLEIEQRAYVKADPLTDNRASDPAPDLLGAALVRVSWGHHDTCGSQQFTPAEPCGCGHDALVAAINKARGGG